MTLHQSWYFMSLVGGLGGLCAWALTTLLERLTATPFPSSVPDLVPGLLLGGMLGGLTAGFGDHWSGGRVRGGAILAGSGAGLLAGGLAVVIAVPIRNALLLQYPVVFRALTWMIVGGVIGLGLGALRAGADGARLANPVAGGLAGGLASGILFTAAGGSFPDVTNALCFALSGVGISSGLTLTPVVAREAALLFVRSGDARAQSKFGRSRKQWPLQHGRSYVIGSGEIAAGPREVAVNIPDAAMAPRHAVVYAKDGRYFIARHEEARAPAAAARYPLKVGSTTVSSARALEHLDEVTVGKTALKFQIRTKEAR